MHSCICRVLSFATYLTLLLLATNNMISAHAAFNVSRPFQKHGMKATQLAGRYFKRAFDADNTTSEAQEEYEDPREYNNWMEYRRKTPYDYNNDYEYGKAYKFDLESRYKVVEPVTDFKLNADAVRMKTKVLRSLAGCIYDYGPDDLTVVTVERESVPKAQIAERLETFGRLGKVLLEKLQSKGIISRAVGILTQRAEITRLESINPELACGYSLLYAEIPIQVRGNTELPVHLARIALDAKLNWEDKFKLKHEGGMNLSREKKDKYFPPKAHAAVTNRTNVWFSEVWQSLGREHRSSLRDFQDMAPLIRGVNNDQATGCLMLWWVLKRNRVRDPELLAMRMVKDPDNAKSLGTALKSLGLQWRKMGAVLVEGESLQGRGVNDISLEEAAEARLEGNTDCLEVNTEQLRAAVKEILDEELDLRKNFYEPTDNFWSRRWEWGVNGSHNKVLQRHEPKFFVKPKGLKRLHRRVYMEEVLENPARDWSGRVYVSMIKKLENYKTRDLQAVDSNTYIAFQHLMQSVEACWRGTRVLLDPGKGGTTGIWRRMQSISNKNLNSAKLMIDYAKYDSHHTLHTQQVVIAETCEALGFPEALSKKLIESFDRMFMYVDGKIVGKVGGTLMSGHRVTTYINSVMNLAYLRIFCPTIRQTKSMHVGDDVFVSAPTLRVAAQIAMELKASPIRAKPEKQSMGTVSGEFLRMCSRGPVVQGYYLRSVSTCIMGQWVSDMRLDANEAVQSMVQASWTLCNRSRERSIGDDLLRSSMCRITGLKGDVVGGLLRGTVALNDGPARHTGRHVKTSLVLKYGQRTTDRNRNETRLNYATKNYLTKHVTPAEREVLRQMESSVEDVMADASYSKSEKDIANRAEVETVIMEKRVVHKGIYTEEIMRGMEFRERKAGLLERFPILNLVKNQMGYEDMELALTCIEADLSSIATEEELYAMCWGVRSEGVAIDGWMPYSEAAALSGVTSKDKVAMDQLMIFA
ncbi:RNA dependent RNA polymerase [viral metagenome]